MEEYEKQLIANIEATAERVNELEDPTDLEVLDVQYTADANKELRNIVLTVTVGGPRIDIDPGNKMVIGYWGSKERSHSIESEAAGLLFDYYEELWRAT